jgi:putative endonuclease
MNEKRWFVYMIRTHDAQLYTGITTDIQRRWHEHLSGKGGARYFRARKPQALCFLEEHLNRSSASKREAAIKKLSKIDKELLVSTPTLPEGLALKIITTPND